jgi:hypothetical protein
MNEVKFISVVSLFKNDLFGLELNRHCTVEKRLDVGRLKVV